MLREILENFCKIFCFHDWERTGSYPIIRLGAYYGEKYNIHIYKKCKKCGAEKKSSKTDTVKW
jgi:hypothetical protein